MFQEIHFRDVIENLLSNHIKEEKSFEWQKEPRCYHNGSELVVTRYLGRSVDYGFEFVCPKNNVLLNILSDAQALHLIYAINSNHLPILYGSNDLLAHFAIANAKNYFSLHVDPHLSMKFIRNLCFGAFYTGSFLEFKSAQELTANQLSTVCNCNKEFMFLEKKDSQMGAIKKEYSYLPSIIAFSLKDLQAEFKPIQ